jgi:hypothetical protein
VNLTGRTPIRLCPPTKGSGYAHRSRRERTACTAAARPRTPRRVRRLPRIRRDGRIAHEVRPSFPPRSTRTRFGFNRAQPCRRLRSPDEVRSPPFLHDVPGVRDGMRRGHRHPSVERSDLTRGSDSREAQAHENRADACRASTELGQPLRLGRAGLQRRRTSPSNQGGENGHQSEKNDASLRAAGGRGFQIEQIEDRQALEGAASRHSVVASLVARGASAGTLRQIQNCADAGAIELVGQLGPLQRKPSNDVRPKSQREAVRVKAVQRSGWREGCNGSGGGIHKRRPFRGHEVRPSP